MVSIDLFHLFGGAGDFEFDLRQETHGVFGAAINFSVSLLTSVALDFGHRQALDADLGERIADFVELEWLDDSHDYFHFQYLPYAHCITGGRKFCHLPRGIRPPCGSTGPPAIKQRANFGTALVF